jgi:hypothetical protein
MRRRTWIAPSGHEPGAYRARRQPSWERRAAWAAVVLGLSAAARGARGDPAALSASGYSQRITFAPPGDVRGDSAPPGRFAILELPDAVLDRCEPGHADLRILDDRGAEWPFVDAQKLEYTDHFTATVEIKRSADEVVATVVLPLRHGRVNGIGLQTEPFRYVLPAVMESSDDGQDWRSIGAGRIRTRAFMPFAPDASRFLRLRLDDRRHDAPPFDVVVLKRETPPIVATEDRAPRSIALSFERSGQGAPPRYVVNLPRANPPTGKVWVGIDPPFWQGLIDLSVPAADPDAPWQTIGSLGAGPPGSTPDPSHGQQYAVAAKLATTRTFAITLRHGFSASGELRSVTLDLLSPQIVFPKPEGTSLWLACGAPDKRPPSHDAKEAWESYFENGARPLWTATVEGSSDGNEADGAPGRSVLRWLGILALASVLAVGGIAVARGVLRAKGPAPRT